MKRTIRFFLLFAMIIVSVIIPGRANSELWTVTEKLTKDVEFSTGYFNDGDRQTEHYLTYYPGGNVEPMLWYGNTLGDRAAFDDAAMLVEAQGKRVIAGTNGDYYVLATGQPVGLVISEGCIITSDGGNPALGFLPDGSAFFGTPALRMSVTIHDERYRLAGINKPIQRGDFFLFTEAYGAKTPTRQQSFNLILLPETDDSLRMDSEIHVIVESVIRSDGPVSIPQGRWVLCLTEDSDDWRRNAVESLEVGEHLTLYISAEDERWSSCTYASGSLYKLITDGVIEEGLDQLDHSRSPRTAVGIREDGSMLFYTVDGRQSSFSAGLTLAETAQRLLDLGCTEAGALDGGGSTVLHAQSAGEDDCVLRSRPSGGQEREVSTFLFLVTQGESSGAGETLSVRSDVEALLCGAQLQLSAGICDEKGAPVKCDGFHWSASAGTITKDGLYTAPDSGGAVEIAASASGLRGLTKILIVETPDTIRVLSQDTGKEVTRLVLDPRETVELMAEASLGQLLICAGDENFIWECTGTAGTIDHSGCFTASEFGGEGTITVSAGKMSMTVGVSVFAPFKCAEDFEHVVFGSAGGLTWEQERNADRVRYGSGSLRIEYDSVRGETSFPISWTEGKQANYLYFWVYGNGSEHSLYAGMDDRDVFLTELDFTGWRLLTLVLDGHSINRLSVRGQGSGTIWLDQALLSNDPVPDLEPPQLSLKTTDDGVTAQIRDMKDGYPEEQNILLTVDGIQTGFSYDRASGRLKASITMTDSISRVTLKAWDSSGNYQSTSVMLTGEETHPFSDMQGHWAETYAVYQCRSGVMSGIERAGDLIFDPNEYVTRAEFAVFLYRWLGLSAAIDDIPNFDDAQDIPSWAEEAVNAVASHGIIQGELNGGRLDFNPYGLLTRAQAATILGRIIPGGSPYADLVFQDAEQIPTWAAANVSRMTFLGIINGFEDCTFRPYDTLTRAQTAKLLTEMR